jgi:glyoxylase-like metal-dependent hydrolase (beta-lactamase superfamily II)
MVTDGSYQAMFLVACHSVILVDAPPTLGHNILKAIRTVTTLPVSHVVYSYAHADHIGAAYLLKGQGVSFIAHEETAKELAQVNDANRPAPAFTFSAEHDLKVCNQTLHFSYKGPNHEPGNIFIYAPMQKVIMLVDIIYPGWVPFNALGESQNIPGYIKAHEQVLSYDFDYLVAGHLNRIGSREDVLVQKGYMTDLFDNCLEAIRLSGAPPNASDPLSIQTALPPVEAANSGNSRALFDAYIDDQIALWCADKTTGKWLGRLAGADVYGQSNAVAMIESMRIDWGYLGPFGVVNA